MMQEPSAQRPLGELFAELATETSTLFHKEMELAKVEMSEKARTAARSAVQLGVAAALALLGAAGLMAGVILLIGLAIPLWVSALLVGVVVSGVAVVVGLREVRSLRALDLVPRKTVRTLEETKQWATTEVSQ